MNEPDIVVEAAFGQPFNIPVPPEGWVDITEYVQGFDTSRGRSNEIGAPQSGSATLTLDNSGGEFTPGNPASPFHPHVNPRTQVRIRDAADTVPAAAGTAILENLFTDPRIVDGGYAAEGNVKQTRDDIRWGLSGPPLIADDTDTPYQARQNTYENFAGVAPAAQHSGVFLLSAGDANIAPLNTGSAIAVRFTPEGVFPDGWWACSPGDHVSACLDAVAVFAGTVTEDPVLAMGFSFMDSSGTQVGSSNLDTVVTVDSSLDNVLTSEPPARLARVPRIGAQNVVVAPAGAAYFVPVLWLVNRPTMTYTISGTQITAQPEYKCWNPAVYNHGQTPFDWTLADYGLNNEDGGPFPVVGPWLHVPGLTGDWTGLPDESTSKAYLADAGGLFNGYVTSWPATVDGLTSDVAVPLSDRYADWGARPLTQPFRDAFLRLEPDMFFPLDESGSVFSDVVTGTQALVQHSLPDRAGLYAGQNIPTVEGGSDSLIEAVHSATSAHATGQALVKHGNAVYALGASLRMLVDVNPAEQGFSFAFVYRFDSFMQQHDSSIDLALDARPYMLVDSRGGGVNRAMFMDIFPQTKFGKTDYLFGLWDDTGKEYYTSLPVSHDILFNESGKGNPVLIYVTWNPVEDRMRVGALSLTGSPSLAAYPGLPWYEYPYSQSLSASNDRMAVNDGSGTYDSVASLFAGWHFDELHVLGFTRPDGKYAGFAEHSAQNLGWWNRELSDRELTGLYRSTTDHYGEYASDRVQRVLARGAGVSHGKILTHFDDTRLGPASGEGPDTTASAAVQQVAQDALAEFTVDGAGSALYRPRAERYNRPADWVFDSSAGTGVESGLSFTSDEQDVQNDVTVTNSTSGAMYEVEADDSVALFGVKAQSYDVNVLSDQYAEQYAYHMVNRYGMPIVRVDGVTVNASAAAVGQLWAHVLGAAVGDKVTLAGLPSLAPAAAADFFVESVSHTVARDGARLTWTTGFDLSPAAAWDAWVLDDTNLGVLSESTVLAL